MSAAPQPHFSVQSFPVNKKRSSSSSRRSVTVSSPISHTRGVIQSQEQFREKLSSNHNFVHKRQYSPRLKSLQLLQRVTLGIGSCLMIGSALVYAATVPIPQLWSQEYEKLQSLQRQERELTAANETIKNDLIKQAQLEANQAQYQLSSLKPNDVLFLEAAKINAEPLESIPDDKDSNSFLKSIPLSY